MHSIQIRGARVHNLKNVHLDIPHGRLVVITGPSGSGKSSLAFDTLFAEGQRQYIESLSLYSRQYLHRLERPDVDSIEGLAPTICVDQRAGRANPRATLGTSTEIHDYLRLMFARLGVAYCPRCQSEIRRQTPAEIEREWLSLPEGSKLMVLAPLGQGEAREETTEAFLERARKAGFVRLYLDGQLIDIDRFSLEEAASASTIDAVVDRLVVRPGAETRLAESLQVALRFGEGTVAAAWQAPGGGADPGAPGAWNYCRMTTIFACPKCRTRYEELTPRTFSFNSPYGACTTCSGLGFTAEANGIRAGAAVCPDCRGGRLNEQARNVRVGGKTLPELAAMPLGNALEFVGTLEFPPHQFPIARPLVEEITRRLQFLISLGLDYLSLSRPTDSLSGGERQRARLGSGLGSSLVGACYILDEPSVGLHPRDNDRLIGALTGLRDLGNTLVVVEHDAMLMRAADWLIDMGPGAGAEGGQVLIEGPPAQLAREGDTATCQVLRNENHHGPRARRSLQGAAMLRLTGATTHNLKNVNVEIPLGRFVCVSGVSGSGKSSLVLETLAPAVLQAARLGDVLDGDDAETDALMSRATDASYTSLSGAESLARVVQARPGAAASSARSNPATYLGVFDEIRKLFAATREARQRGFRASRFSPSDAQGRCPECRGLGKTVVEMNFLPDLTLICPLCRGARFNRQTLLPRFRGKNIAEVLAMTVRQAAGFFDSFVKIAGPLFRIEQIGLGYLPLGQPADTLSGGEWQRLRLAKELSAAPAGPALFLFDEPTTGLSSADVARLISVLQELVNQGHSVLAIEHNLELIVAADWVIDMGPEGGDAGGRIVVAGTPEQVAACPSSVTGRFLRPLLGYGRGQGVE